jgi:methylated-DNA-[protein]-cysteine S-methyltransferase
LEGLLVIYFCEYKSPVGLLTLASDGLAICGLWITEQKYFGAGLLEGAMRDANAGGLPELTQWLDAYFETPGVPPKKDVALAPIGSEFRQAVWRELQKIPYGETTTYGAIAAKLKKDGIKASPIAVGGAVGHNPISIIIPCHRVVGANGKLTGYAGGLDKKEWLLAHEKTSPQGKQELEGL